MLKPIAAPSTSHSTNKVRVLFHYIWVCVGHTLFVCFNYSLVANTYQPQKQPTTTVIL